MSNIIEFSQAWPEIEIKYIEPLTRALEKDEKFQISAKDFVYLYGMVHQMCTQHDPYNFVQQIYENYIQSIRQFLAHSIAPTLKQKLGHRQELLLEWSKAFNRYDLFLQTMDRLLSYLKRFPCNICINNTSMSIEQRVPIENHAWLELKTMIFDVFHDDVSRSILESIRLKDVNVFSAIEVYLNLDNALSPQFDKEKVIRQLGLTSSSDIESANMVKQHTSVELYLNHIKELFEKVVTSNESS